MIKPGDVAFFRECKRESKRNAPIIKFKGHAFGVLLGEVPLFQKDPPPEHLLRLMGTIGFLTFDDVGEFLGNENGALCVKKFEDKYYGKLPEDPQEEPIKPPSGLVDLSGKPIDNSTN